MVSLRKKRELDEIAASSMSDIAFLLLIFFMVASVFYVKEGIISNLPKKDSPKKQVLRENIFVVRISGEKVRFSNPTFGDKYYTTLEEFDNGLSELQEKEVIPPKPKLLGFTGKSAKFALLTTEGKTTVQQMVSALGVVKTHGFKNISFQKFKGQ